MHQVHPETLSTRGSFHELPSEGGFQVFSLAGKHLLYSFPHFLRSQGHHHLGYRGSLQLSAEGHSEEPHHSAVFGPFQAFGYLLQFAIQHVLS